MAEGTPRAPRRGPGTKTRLAGLVAGALFAGYLGYSLPHSGGGNGLYDRAVNYTTGAAQSFLPKGRLLGMSQPDIEEILKQRPTTGNNLTDASLESLYDGMSIAREDLYSTLKPLVYAGTFPANAPIDTVRYQVNELPSGALGKADRKKQEFGGLILTLADLFSAYEVAQATLHDAYIDGWHHRRNAAISTLDESTKSITTAIGSLGTTHPSSYAEANKQYGTLADTLRQETARLEGEVERIEALDPAPGENTSLKVSDRHRQNAGLVLGGLLCLPGMIVGYRRPKITMAATVLGGIYEVGTATIPAVKKYGLAAVGTGVGAWGLSRLVRTWGRRRSARANAAPAQQGTSQEPDADFEDRRGSSPPRGLDDRVGSIEAYLRDRERAEAAQGEELRLRLSELERAYTRIEGLEREGERRERVSNSRIRELEGALEELRREHADYAARLDALSRPRESDAAQGGSVRSRLDGHDAPAEGGELGDLDAVRNLDRSTTGGGGLRHRTDVVDAAQELGLRRGDPGSGASGEGYDMGGGATLYSGDRTPGEPLAPAGIEDAQFDHGVTPGTGRELNFDLTSLELSNDDPNADLDLGEPDGSGNDGTVDLSLDLDFNLDFDRPDEDPERR